MKHLMFSIYDEKAHAYLPPWFLPTEGMAVRAFSDCVNDNEHNFGRHPADYTLFFLAEFSDRTGMLDALPAKKCLGNGVEFRNLELDDVPALQAVNGGDRETA